MVFTTYALSLSFFEAVVLDRLVRGGGRNALILSDPEGIRAGLSERGASRAGRDYELEPVVCPRGVFHPKLGLFFNGPDVHMLVGSGNLTFGGWGMNLEVVEHIHPSFAAEAFDDAADFFEYMSTTGVKCGVQEELESIGAELRLRTVDASRTGAFRLLHSVEQSISEQIVAIADDLGGAERVTVVCPYFDANGVAITRLAEALGCDEVLCHVHPAAPVYGPMGINWPDANVVKPVYISEPFGEDPRHLHAKCFEIICRRGRMLMTGSANATLSALGTGNIEASLVRIQRDTFLGWTPQACSPPVQLIKESEAEDKDSESNAGILRASLDGDHIHGQVLEPAMSGKAQLFVERTTGPIDLGNITLDDEGRFSAAAPDLEMQSWASGRMVLRLEQGEQSIEGFVSLTAAAEIIRRAGAMAARLFAILAGTETPSDVAAILTWFKEDPQRILTSAISGAGQSENPEAAPVWVPVEELRSAGVGQASGRSDMDGGSPAWKRSLQLIRAAFASKRGPWQSGAAQDDPADIEDNNSDEQQERTRPHERDQNQAMDAFDLLLDDILDDDHGGQHVSVAFALAHYLVDRIQPDRSRVENWMMRILNAVSRLSAGDNAELVAAELLVRSTDGHPRAPERSRRFLLRNGIDPDTLEVDPTSIEAFVNVFDPDWNGAEFLHQVKSARTPGEQVRSYLKAADENGPHHGFEQLIQSRYWSRLERAILNPSARTRLVVAESIGEYCPKCNIKLSSSEREEVREMGVTIHCQVLLSKEI